jgi:hypothetical protein
VNSTEALVGAGRALEHAQAKGAVQKRILESVSPSCCHAGIAVGGEVAPLLPGLVEQTWALRRGRKVG